MVKMDLKTLPAETQIVLKEILLKTFEFIQQAVRSE